MIADAKLRIRISDLSFGEHLGGNRFGARPVAPGSPELIYTFQDTVSFFRFGLFTEYKGPPLLEEDGPLAYTFTADELRDLYDLAGAAQQKWWYDAKIRIGDFD